MPKEKELTKKLKAKHRTKSYIEAGLNQSKMARTLGKHRSTVNSQVNKKPVQDALQQYLDSPVLKRRLRDVAKDGLSAKKPKGYYSKKLVKDHDVRHKFWRDLMIVNGSLKQNGTGRRISVLTIVYGHRTENPHCSIRSETGQDRVPA